MAESSIREVAVYKSGAIIKRQGTVHLEKGEQTVNVKGLKASEGSFIAADSVKLAVDERVSGSNVQVESMSSSDIEKTLRPIADKIEEKQKEIEILELQENAWRQNSDFTGKESVSIEAMVSYIDSLEGRLKALGEKKAAAGKELEDLNRDYEEHRKYLAEPSVKANLYCEEEGDYAFELTYYLRDTYWYPFYEIHTDDDTDSVTVKLRAKVRQNTEEDWKGVKLSLYATDPSLSGTIPELYPAHVGFRAEMPRANFAAGKMMMAMDSAMAEPAEEMAMMGAEMPGAFAMKSVATKGASFRNNDSVLEYELEGLWDVPAKKEIICDLSSKQVACRYHDICVPKLDSKAYLAAEVKTSDVEDLMDTEASIYIRGAYMGDAYLSMDLSKDEYDISLGVDETVKVNRKQLKKYTSSVLLKGQKKTEIAYEISISSKKDRECALRLTDQIPISDDKAIEVVKDELSGGELTEETGLVRWDLCLKPGETVKKTLAYTVSYPKDKRVTNI